jgi:hypothetical protein
MLHTVMVFLRDAEKPEPSPLAAIFRERSRQKPWACLSIEKMELSGERARLYEQKPGEAAYSIDRLDFQVWNGYHLTEF